MDTSDFLESKPLWQERPDFCHKCGRCCKSATTALSAKELADKALAGDKDSADFLRVFEPFESIEAARKVVPEQVDQVLRVYAENPEKDINTLTFYHCRYVTDDGLCGIYDSRPAFCERAPGSGWALMPPGCGFEGWEFLQREKQKAEVRKLKEMQARLTTVSLAHPDEPQLSLNVEVLNKRVDETIAVWKRYGAAEW